MKESAIRFDDGEAYERLMGRWSRKASGPFLDWLAASQGLAWIDVGCGNGAFTAELMARTGPRAVTGIDPSPAQLAYARARPGAAGAEFREGSAEALPFADRSFDAAVMALAIAFVPDPSKGVAEMARVVRKGGLVAAYMWDIPARGVPTSPVAAAARSLGLAPPQPPSADVSRREALDALWREAGLADVATTVIRVPVEFASFAEFWDSNCQKAGPTGNMVAKLPPETRAELRARLAAALPEGPDGKVRYEAVANAVKGRVKD